MSFLAVMASYLILKRKIPVLKETESPVREVVQGIPTAFAASKKKVRKRGRTAHAAFSTQDSSRERSGTNEGSPIDHSPNEIKHNARSLGSNLME
uniref:Uncharacterized protein n=1 Tax=Cannabis sativa TaxID=3483 RepID=A0A803PL13_CANSA